MAKNIMIQGTMSGVGKSLLCTALCRIFRRDGWRVAPFKSQNMALNSYVTADGGEIGRAQAVQAEAAGIAPDVRMNPVLLKPSSDTGSEVIVGGQGRGHMAAAEYFRYKPRLFPEILAAYDSLAAEYDVIVIEGAGSPAEINLRENDIVNMGFAERVHAPVLLAGDIDRGGVFAQLYGTAALLEPPERARIRGLIINRFRGDIALLKPGLAPLETLTGIPVLGVVPFLDVELDSEDSLDPSLGRRTADKAVDIAVIRFPRISNFTDFAPLDRHPRLGVRYVNRSGGLGEPDLVILPGTTDTLSDLQWLREQGLESAVRELAANGRPVLGICGGYQMLGAELSDPEQAEGAIPAARGIALLPCRTTFTPSKQLKRREAVITGGPLDGVRVKGYEIHRGRTAAEGMPFCRLEDGTPEGCRRGNIWGTCLHGLFDSGEAVKKLAAWLCRRKGVEPLNADIEPGALYRERQYDRLADGVRAALDMDAVRRILEEGA